MKVLIVQHGLFPGFVAPVAKECAKNLCLLGVDVRVAAIGKLSTMSAAEPLNFPIYSIDHGGIPATYYHLRDYIRQVDVVHYFLGKGLELMPLLSRSPKYVFHHISGSVTGDRPRDGLINFGKRLQPIFADHVIFTDQALATSLDPFGGKPVSLLPVGYADDLFYPCPPPPPAAHKQLLYHGAVRHQRRLDQLVRVLSLLPDEYTLTILGGGSAGDEEYKQSLAALAKTLHCADRLSLVNMAQADIRAVIDKTYLCLSYVPILECYQEQFVLKTLEYLACHRPVLATATRYTTRFREAIGGDRILLTDDTIEDMADKIANSAAFVTQFHSPDNLRSLSADLAPYSSRLMVETKLLPIYQSLLNS
jgi:glycosyltransferase involved in cell wall biosynthesis